MLQDSAKAHRTSEIKQILDEFDWMVSMFTSRWIPEDEAKDMATSVQREKYK